MPQQSFGHLWTKLSTMLFVSHILCYITAIVKYRQPRCHIRYTHSQNITGSEESSQSQEESSKDDTILDIVRQKHTRFIEHCKQSCKYAQVVKNNRLNTVMSPEQARQYYISRYPKLMVLTPGGINGFYMMGVARYITQHMNTDDYIFSGSSAGAWCGLFLCLKQYDKYSQCIINMLEELQKISSTTTLYGMLYSMKRQVLEMTTTEDYQLDRLFIGVLKYESYTLTTTIYTDFVTLEDAVDCCISSSHIPFITGEMNCMYHGHPVFDGAFSRYPFVNIYPPTIIISPDLWKQSPYTISQQIASLSMNKLDVLAMFWNGYRDTLLHKSALFEIMENT